MFWKLKIMDFTCEGPYTCNKTAFRYKICRHINKNIFCPNLKIDKNGLSDFEQILLLQDLIIVNCQATSSGIAQEYWKSAPNQDFFFGGEGRRGRFLKTNFATIHEIWGYWEKIRMILQTIWIFGSSNLATLDCHQILVQWR